jgi:hypothetical protein
MEQKKYDIQGYDIEDVIKINTLLNELDEIFNNALSVNTIIKNI